jgi:Tfp pilus assembly protein FimT
VVIGILAAVALPKFKNLQKSAEINTMVKTTYDIARNAAQCGVDLIDIEESHTPNSISLKTCVTINNKNWVWLDKYKLVYRSNLSKNQHAVTISLKGRKVTYTIDCLKFKHDRVVQKKCESLIGNQSTLQETIEF